MLAVPPLGFGPVGGVGVMPGLEWEPGFPRHLALAAGLPIPHPAPRTPHPTPGVTGAGSPQLLLLRLWTRAWACPSPVTVSFQVSVPGGSETLGDPVWLRRGSWVRDVARIQARLGAAQPCTPARPPCLSPEPAVLGRPLHSGVNH